MLDLDEECHIDIIFMKKLQHKIGLILSCNALSRKITTYMNTNKKSSTLYNAQNVFTVKFPGTLYCDAEIGLYILSVIVARFVLYKIYCYQTVNLQFF